MTTKESFLYTLKIWLSSWFFTPIILFILILSYEYFTEHKPLYDLIFKKNNLLDLSLMDIFGLVYVISFLFSLPYWLLLWPGIKIISRSSWNIKTNKLLISILSSLLLGIVFWIFNSGMLSVSGIPWFLSTLVGIWYYPFHKKSKPKGTKHTLEDHLLHIER